MIGRHEIEFTEKVESQIHIPLEEDLYYPLLQAFRVDVGAPNLRIQFDFYHAQIVGGDLIRRFEAHLPLIGHVQVAGVPLRREPDEGEVNYPEIFAALDRLGYPGFVGCEYRPRGRTEDGLGWARPYGVVPKG